MPEKLRKEIHHASVERGTCRCLGLDGEEFYWQEFGKTCELALDIQKAGEPKVEVREG